MLAWRTGQEQISGAGAKQDSLPCLHRTQLSSPTNKGVQSACWDGPCHMLVPAQTWLLPGTLLNKYQGCTREMMNQCELCRPMSEPVVSSCSLGSFNSCGSIVHFIKV